MKKNVKMAVFWILGSALIFLGSMIAGHLEKTLGVSDTGYLLALLVAFILFLAGGLLWISTAVAVKEISEK